MYFDHEKNDFQTNCLVNFFFIGLQNFNEIFLLQFVHSLY